MPDYFYFLLTHNVVSLQLIILIGVAAGGPLLWLSYSAIRRCIKRKSDITVKVGGDD